MNRSSLFVCGLTSVASLAVVLVAVGACTSDSSSPVSPTTDAGPLSVTNCPNGGVMEATCVACIETSCSTELAAVDTACASAIACACPLGADAAACTPSSACTSAITSAAEACAACYSSCDVSSDAGGDAAIPGDAGQDSAAPDAGTDAGPAGPDLWVTDSFGGATPSVLRFSSAALQAGGGVTPTMVLGGTNTTFAGPSCVAFDASGNLWVVDSKGSKQTGQLDMFPASVAATGGDVAPSLTIAGTSTLLGNPAGCAFDASGALWVANIDPIQANATVVAFSATQLAQGGNIAPSVLLNVGCNNIDLAFDSAGDLWVANLCSDLADYPASELATGGTIGARQSIALPTGVSGIAFDSAGNLWASMQGGVNGVAELVANGDGGLGTATSVTISGTNTTMSGPIGVAFLGSELWVVQQTSNALTMFGSSLLAQGGNVAPTLTVSGTGTQLNSPSKLVAH